MAMKYIMMLEMFPVKFACCLIEIIPQFLSNSCLLFKNCSFAIFLHSSTPQAVLYKYIHLVSDCHVYFRQHSDLLDMDSIYSIQVCLPACASRVLLSVFFCCVDGNMRQCPFFICISTSV